MRAWVCSRVARERGSCSSRRRSYNFCVGCGIDFSSRKSYEKRLLCSETACAERKVWERIAAEKLQSDFSLDFSEVFGSPRYVCRTCFAGFRRLGQLQRELLEKVGRAITKVFSLSTPRLPRDIGSKRRSERCDSGGGTPKSLHLGDDGASDIVTSPDVSVMNQHA